MNRRLPPKIVRTCEEMQGVEINPMSHKNGYSDDEIVEITELFEVRRRVKNYKFCISWEDANGIEMRDVEILWRGPNESVSNLDEMKEGKVEREHSPEIMRIGSKVKSSSN